MVAYNPKEWLKPLFMFHKDDTFRKLLPMLLLLGSYAFGLVYFEKRFFQPDKNSHINGITIMHSLLGFVISILLVFRTNSAYDRWWEGRKLWGNLVNCSRNLAVKLNVMLPQEDKSSRYFFVRLLSILPHELRLHLQNEKTRLELDTNPHPEIPDFDRSGHIPSQVVSLMHGRVKKMIANNQLTNEEWWILNAELTAFLDICGACERIKNTPIPWTYITFIKKFIFVYVLTLPMGLVYSMGFLSVPVVMLVFYVLASLEVIAEEIEDPFGKDTNDLPMEKLAANIAKNVEEILN